MNPAGAGNVGPVAAAGAGPAVAGQGGPLAAGAGAGVIPAGNNLNTRPMPAHILSAFLPNLNPDTVDPAIARANGQFLFDFMMAFVSGDWESLMEDFHMDMNGIQQFLYNGQDPHELVNEALRNRIRRYFDRPLAKEWLGRQYYLGTGVDWQIGPGAAPVWDDVPMVIRWLVLRHDPHTFVSPSPIPDSVQAPQQGGRRRRRRITRRSSRRNRSRRT